MRKLGSVVPRPRNESAGKLKKTLQKNRKYFLVDLRSEVEANCALYRAGRMVLQPIAGVRRDPNREVL